MLSNVTRLSFCRLSLCCLIIGALSQAWAQAGSQASIEADDGWVDLFNGRDLSGWTPKIRGYALGDNFARTFRVEEGLLKVRYEGYERFENRFGHLFWRSPQTAYHLRVEYRFVGDQVAGGADWAIRNSGVMLHAQAPETIGIEQDFPVSIEAQFLGGLDSDRPRPTGNLCTPGTDVIFEGALYTPHCLNSSSLTYLGDQWVTAELIVRGSGTITHLINGAVVLEYSAPQLSDPAAHQRGSTTGSLLDGGFIALQSESHPVDFRRVQLKLLGDRTP